MFPLAQPQGNLPSSGFPASINPNSLNSYLSFLSQSGPQSLTAGKDAITQGLQSFAAPLSYYQDILSGNKSQMEAAEAPEKSDILAQYRARRRQLAQGPRGGGTNAAVATSEFSQAGDVAALLQKLRPQAAQGEADIAGKVAGLGVQEEQIGNQQLFTALSTLLGKRGQNFSLLESLL